MRPIEPVLRYYFITDDGPATCSPLEQVRIALAAGATLVQYRNKHFALPSYDEVSAIHALCRRYDVPLIINDNVLLTKAVGAEGVHLGQDDDTPQAARQILGPHAIIGLSVSTLEELARSRLQGCDYIGSGPVFVTRTKADAKPVRGLDGLASMVRAAAPLPVVAIGGITAANAAGCFARGAAGVAVISTVSRAPEPQTAARAMAAVCQSAV
jgi:thiamine-phosphate pyrophosphorylase